MEPRGAPPGARRKAAALTLGTAALLLPLLLAGCSAGTPHPTAAKGDASAADAESGPADITASTAVLTISPKDGATDVATTGTLKVTTAGGTLSSVVVRNDNGAVVPGTISADGLGWTPARLLDTSTAYTVDATAEDPSGRESDKHSAFTTVVPKDTFVGFFAPQDGSTVGVGMEVHLHFNRPITDKKAVAGGVTVTASPAVPVAAKWNADQDLYIRPKDYWAAGTEVTLGLRLKGVEGAPGVYGRQDEQVHFTIGRRQVSIVDVAGHTMTVYRDDKAVRTLPVSSGAPDHATYNGTMVISEKYVKTRMNGDTVGFGGEYDIPDVPHAMRLTDSGTFLHGNYWAPPSVFGSTDTSHGCVGLQDVRGAGDATTPAAWFYANSLIGDVVQVVNSRDRTVQWYNGLNGWNLGWRDWTS